MVRPFPRCSRNVNSAIVAARPIFIRIAALCPAWVRRYGLRAVAAYAILNVALIPPEIHYHFLERLTAYDLHALVTLVRMIALSQPAT
jgi:hypothetical protein